MISTTSYATKWYITLFANTVPFQMQLRLWDAFLLDGLDVLVAMALYVIWTFKGLSPSTIFRAF
jgi:USP6 N-terminal-like protein